MSAPSFPLRAVAALFIERQHLDRPRGRLTAAGLERFAADAGGIQLDSINVLERAHYLTVWSRFGPYDRRRLDRMIYRDRVLFEYWAHAACLIAASQLPAWRRAMLDYHPRHTGWRAFLKKNARLLSEVEEAIRKDGPLANADFEHERGGRSGGWWSWKPATHALHHLWMTGRLLVDTRVHFQKRFDLAERVMPDLARIEPPSAPEFARWRLSRSLHAMGAATEIDLRMYLTFPHVAAGERARVLRGMLADGEVVEVAVEENPGRWYALAEDLEALAAAGRRARPARGTTLLSPFDSFLWHRDRTKRLFGFDYRIEVYTPGHKRTHGYYSLPIFHDGRLIGRLDAKTHREEQRLEVRRVHFERWFTAGDAAPVKSWNGGVVEAGAAFAGLASALASLASFVGAKRVTLGRVAPARLRPPLARALRDSVAPAPGHPAKPGPAPEPQPADA